MEQTTFSFAHFWAQGDAVSHTVAYVLLAMSIASWYLILARCHNAWRLRRTVRHLDSFWSAPAIEQAVAGLKQADPLQVFTPLATNALQAARRDHAASLNAQAQQEDLLTRTLRRDILRTTTRLERGLTVLASVGATAPFVGLFGTVWGIYHALTSIAAGNAAQIDKLIGPVGEALIMTAFGLVVAIPAVLAYNAFNRGNQVALAELDGFAYDLQAFLTTGDRVTAGASA